MPIDMTKLRAIVQGQFLIRTRFVVIEIHNFNGDQVQIARGQFVWGSDARAICRFILAGNDNLSLLIVDRFGRILNRFDRETPEPPMIIDEYEQLSTHTDPVPTRPYDGLEPYDGVPADTGSV